MYIVLLFDEIFYRHQLGPFNLWCHLVPFVDFFCLNDLSIGERVLLKSPTATVLESVYAFKSFSVCLMKLGALTLGAYRLINVIFLMYCPFYLYEVSFFVSFEQCKFEVYFV
jgi:hypothetical protein